MSTAATIEVVAAAIVRGYTVLAARRRAPARLAGGWEFPGGKIDPGEDGPGALVRECREELGVDIRVGQRLAATTGNGIRIVLFAATLAAGEPAPLEDHDELRWLTADELTAVPWLPLDVDLLPAASRYLRSGNRRSTL